MPDTEPIPADASLPASDLAATLPDPPPTEEPASMIDVHPAHHAASTWRDFFIHIATIVLGLLIAVGLEQTVELIHHHREAREARENIQQEAAKNLDILERDQHNLADTQKQLAKDLDLLNSSAHDAEILAQLDYTYTLTRRLDAAWTAAKINGSLALIPSSQIEHVSYFYDSTDALGPTVFDYFTKLYTASALIDHARTAGQLTAPERQQLLSITISAMGTNQFISKMFSSQMHALQSNDLR